MRAILLGGGSGTRLKPLTNSKNKHEIIVGDKSLLEHALINILTSGIQEIVINTNNTYADKNFVANLISKYSKLYKNVVIANNKTESKGLAAELVQSKNFLEGDSFAVVFGDTVFEKPEQFKKYVNKYLNSKYDAMFLTGSAEEPQRHATPFYEGDRIIKVVEKCQNPPHNQVVTTWDIYPSVALTYLSELKPSARNELELTDLRNLVIQRLNVGYETIDGWWIDAGIPKDLLKATMYVLYRDKIANNSKV